MAPNEPLPHLTTLRLATSDTVGPRPRGDDDGSGHTGRRSLPPTHFRPDPRYNHATEPPPHPSPPVPRLITVAALVATTLTLAACENTIRGVGRDTANAVDATGDAIRRTGRALD